jgi:SAM-dependent methyltransferase
MTSDDDPYAPIAPVYDEWHEWLGTGWVPRLETHLERFGLVPATFAYLDLACGTGTLLLALRARHPTWRLAGLDASAAMLDIARRKPDARSVNWTHATFEHAGRLGTFEAVGCFFDGFNHLRDVPELLVAFQAAAAGLVPGGLLIFDLNNRHGCEDRSQRRFHGAGPGWEVITRCAFDPASSLETARLSIRRGQALEVETEVVRRCFAPKDVTGALETAGFVTECEETWSFAPGEVAGKTWYVARLNRSEMGGVR